MEPHSHLSQQHQSSFDHVITHLKEKGVRITETRKAVVAYVIEQDNHPSAEMIYKDLLPSYPGMSLATVYNNLRPPLEEGLSPKSNDQMTPPPTMTLRATNTSMSSARSAEKSPTLWMSKSQPQKRSPATNWLQDNQRSPLRLRHLP